MAIRKLDHVGICVEDMEKSLAFYCGVLGMTVQKDVQIPSGPRLAFLQYPNAPDTVIELVAGERNELSEAGRVHHLAFTVDNLDEVMQQLTNQGISWMQGAPNTLPDGTRYMFFYGPDREHLELFQPPKG